VATLISSASTRHLAAALELRNIEYLATREGGCPGDMPAVLRPDDEDMSG